MLHPVAPVLLGLEESPGEAGVGQQDCELLAATSGYQVRRALQCRTEDMGATV